MRGKACDDGMQSIFYLLCSKSSMGSRRLFGSPGMQFTRSGSSEALRVPVVVSFLGLFGADLVGLVRHCRSSRPPELVRGTVVLVLPIFVVVSVVLLV